VAASPRFDVRFAFIRRAASSRPSCGWQDLWDFGSECTFFPKELGQKSRQKELIRER